MVLSTVYMCVSDMKKSIDFYTAFLGEGPCQANDDRWASFKCGISLYNSLYDANLLINGQSDCFNSEYINEFIRDKGKLQNNIVVFNFYTQDLRKEYERLKKIGIGEVSDIMYVNVHAPYWYFNLYDPDGNVLEITGDYSNE